MCGIAGIVDHGAGFGRRQLAAIAGAMRDTLIHRGPDDAGLWIDDAGVCALAQRRLAIIDLRPEGRQPMTNEDGSVAVTFNGEIYNYRELRHDLERQGHRFRSLTDTEVLPHLFESLDPAEVERLDGMFAFAVWRQAERRLLLARDPFGKKPLYHAQGPGWFAFASELHALRQVPGFDDALDEDALGFYLLQGYVPAPWSIVRSAGKVPPGCWLSIDFRQQPTPTLHRFSRFEPRPPRWLDRFRSLDGQVEPLRQAVIQAVRKRLVADVPLGAFLSGGVDSSLVVATMVKELGVPVRTFSIGFADSDETEHVHARQIARHLGTEHHDELLRPDVIELVHDIAQMLDEPNGDSSCLPTYLLSRFARQHVKVALSGDGGDELFGGYPRYADTLRQCAWRVGRTPADAYLSYSWFSLLPEQVRELLGGLPAGLAERLAEWRGQLNDPRLPVLHRLRRLDAGHYLPGAVLAKVDRMSMQVALEVRCPLLDREVARFAETLPPRACWQAPAQTKRLLKRLASRYLPAEWMARPKMGFGIPTRTWRHDRLLGLAHDLLDSTSSRLGQYLLPGAVRRFLAEQSQRFSLYQTWPLLILELWLRNSQAGTAGGEAAEPLISVSSGKA